VYVNRCTPLLAVQIDAAINSGNSGGPVFLGKKVVRWRCPRCHSLKARSRSRRGSWLQVGIAFSRRLKAQNIGHIIPVPVIQRFLTEYDRSGKVTFIDAGVTVNVHHVASSVGCRTHASVHRSPKWRAPRCGSTTV